MALRILSLPLHAIPANSYRLSSSSSSTSTSCRCGPCGPTSSSQTFRCYTTLTPLILRTRRWPSHVVRMAPEEEKMTRRSPLDFPIVSSLIYFASFGFCRTPGAKLLSLQIMGSFYLTLFLWIFSFVSNIICVGSTEWRFFNWELKKESAIYVSRFRTFFQILFQHIHRYVFLELYQILAFEFCEIGEIVAILKLCRYVQYKLLISFTLLF